MSKYKKKAGSKKKSSRKQGVFNNKSTLIIIGVLLFVLVFYGLLQVASFTNFLSTNATREDTYTPSSSANNRKEEQDEPETTNIQTKKENTTSPVVESVTTNKNLPVYTNDDTYHYAHSFDFHWPSYTQNDPIVEHTYYTLRYNEKTEQADWVAYILTKQHLAKKYKRKDNFRPDPDVKTKSAGLTDYRGSGYDRGHLAPAADFAWTAEGMDESFFMSNMSPQDPGFNRGIWKKLEGNVRKWAYSNNKLFVVTGPIYKKQATTIGKNKVAVPKQYFKVILELTGKEVKGIGFVLDNKKSSKSLSAYALSIDKVEKITGLDFFPSIPDELEKKIESTYNYNLWK